MNEVYVVTVGGPSEDKGEFYKEEAYASESVAVLVAGECMEANGGRERYQKVQGPEVVKPEHVVHQWDSPRFTVWLERLELVR